MIFAAKYHSYGNDFLIIPAESLPPEQDAKLARSICDLHRGIGADGCVFLRTPAQARFQIRIFNRDGSEAGISGNGARCASAFVHHRQLAHGERITLETGSGVKIFTLLERRGETWKYRSSMGVPRFDSGSIPFREPQAMEFVADHPLQVGDRQVRVHALSVGNPQCVVFVRRLPEEPEFTRLGSGLERHPSFPERTNVSFVQVRAPHQLLIKIWERGVGPTFSSGSGSCGAAVAAIQAERARSPVEVRTESGSQRVEWEPGGEIMLTGEAEFIGEVHYRWREQGV